MSIMSFLIRIVGSCFLVAVFVYLIYIVHLNFTTEVFKNGYDYGRQSCAQDSIYIEPLEEYEGV